MSLSIGQLTHSYFPLSSPKVAATTVLGLVSIPSALAWSPAFSDVESLLSGSSEFTVYLLGAAAVLTAVTIIALGSLCFSKKSEGLPQDIINSVQNDTQAVLAALDKGTVGINAVSPTGQTLLMMAIYKGDADFVSALIQRRANLDLADCRGRTPIIAAFEMGSVEIVKALVKAGVHSIDAKSKARFLQIHTSGDLHITLERQLSSQ